MGLAMSDDRLKNLTLQQMEALIFLVEERSFSRAAKRMLLTQPALTKNIRHVEDCLGVKVVNRSSAGVTLTPEGKILYDYARRIVRLRRDAADKIHQLQEQTGGDIYLCASTIPATYILPHAMSEFKKSHADIRIFLKTEDSEDVMNMVLDREVEIGCIGKKPQSAKLIAEPVWQDRLILIVPKGHRWIKKGSIAVSELTAEPFVLREKGSATRDVFESYMKEHKAVGLSQFNICGELGSSEAIKEAVMAGLGVSVLSAHAVRRELASNMLFEIPMSSCRIERRFHLIYLRQFELRLHHKIFVDFLKTYQMIFAELKKT
jgi:DNA-binding transcriptional LysR family regulator